MPIHPSGAPYRIVLPDLEMRCWEPADAPELQRFLADNDEYLRPWVPWMADEPKPLEAKVKELRSWRAAFDLDQTWLWSLRLSGGALAGGSVMNRLPGDAVDLGGWGTAELGGRGLYGRAAAAATRVAFELLGMARVQGICESTNTRSIHVMRRLGFTHEATPRHEVEGQRIDEMVWSILAEEWPSTPACALAADAQAFDALGERMF